MVIRRPHFFFSDIFRNLLRKNRAFHIYLLFSFIVIPFDFAGAAKDTIEISSSTDFKAPEIVHDLDNDINKDAKGNILVRAKVTDEVGVKSVNLYFKDSSDNKYRKRSMSLDVENNKDIYTVIVPNTAITNTSIEYYFEADDDSGNKKLKGLEFSPLKKALKDLAVIESEKPESVAKKQSESIETTESMSSEEKSLFETPMVWMPGL